MTFSLWYTLGVVVLLYWAIFKYAIAGAQLQHAPLQEDLELQKKMEKNAKKTFLKVTLVLLLALMVSIVVENVYPRSQPIPCGEFESNVVNRSPIGRSDGDGYTPIELCAK